MFQKFKLSVMAITAFLAMSTSAAPYGSAQEIQQAITKFNATLPPAKQVPAALMQQFSEVAFGMRLERSALVKAMTSGQVAQIAQTLQQAQAAAQTAAQREAAARVAARYAEENLLQLDQAVFRRPARLGRALDHHQIQAARAQVQQLHANVAAARVAARYAEENLLQLDQEENLCWQIM